MLPVSPSPFIRIHCGIPYALISAGLLRLSATTDKKIDAEQFYYSNWACHSDLCGCLNVRRAFQGSDGPESGSE